MSAPQVLLQEAAQCTTDVLKIQQEGIMTEKREVLAQFNVLDGRVAACTEGLGNLALLPGREKDVAGDAHDENSVVLQRGETHD